MANQEHLDILKQGVKIWNQWRKEHPDIDPDLSEADLTEADLRKVNFRGATLTRAYLGHTNLSGANLRGAFLTDIYLGSANLSSTNLKGADLVGANLSRADLSGANLSRANLSEASLYGADLLGANLIEADLSKADLSYADLSNALLNGADLSEADLSEALLKGASLINIILRKAHLNKANLHRADLFGAYLSWTDFSDANLSGATLFGAYLREANLSRANLSGANLSRANFFWPHIRATIQTARSLTARSENGDGPTLKEEEIISWDKSTKPPSGANLSEADLRRANLSGATLSNANLSGADLSEANLSGADLRRANLSGATLRGANFSWANLSGVDLSRADITGCFVYATSAWDVLLEETIQANLIITAPVDPRVPSITVDNLEIAQFIYLLLNNQKIRGVIDTITSKVVLILGRFTPERKTILDAIRDALRKKDYVPIQFDFDQPHNRDVTETVTLLARMARFMLADITDAKSIPQELAFIVPDLPSVPVKPLLLSSQREYGMFEHFTRFPWVLPVYHYTDQASLLQSLNENVIDPAEQKAQELEKR